MLIYGASRWKYPKSFGNDASFDMDNVRFLLGNKTRKQINRASFHLPIPKPAACRPGSFTQQRVGKPGCPLRYDSYPGSPRGHRVERLYGNLAFFQRFQIAMPSLRQRLENIYPRVETALSEFRGIMQKIRLDPGRQQVTRGNIPNNWFMIAQAHNATFGRNRTNAIQPRITLMTRMGRAILSVLVHVHESPLFGSSRIAISCLAFPVVGRPMRRARLNSALDDSGISLKSISLSDICPALFA